MKSVAYITILTLILAFMVLWGACLPTFKPTVNDQAPVISSIEVSYPVIYPLGYSEIKCVASDPQGDGMKYTWSSTGGKLSGEGATVRWTAPADYGDYHVMVVVRDNQGNSIEGTATVSVVVRPPEACCGGKGR